MSFIERVEESPAQLIATALTLNLTLLSWILDRFLETLIRIMTKDCYSFQPESVKTKDKTYD